MAIFKIKGNFWQFFLKICQVFGNFLTVKWQFSGGSNLNYTSLHSVHIIETSSITIQGFLKLWFNYKQAHKIWDYNMNKYFDTISYR